jgi:hypothetical protein
MAGACRIGNAGTTVQTRKSLGDREPFYFMSCSNAFYDKPSFGGGGAYKVLLLTKQEAEFVKLWFAIRAAPRLRPLPILVVVNLLA